MRKVIIIILQFIILNIAVSVNASEKVKIAILNITANNTSESTAAAVRDILEIALYKTNEFELLERNKMDVVLKEQGLQMTGCTDTSCAVEIGKMLSADMVLIGSISKLGKYTIAVKLIDIKVSKIVFADSDESDSENDIRESLNRLVGRMIKSKQNNYIITEEPEPASEISSSLLEELGIKDKTYDKTGYFLRGIVPGWGQWYADKPVKGLAFFSLFSVTGIFWFNSHSNYLKAKDDYYKLEAYNSITEYKDKRDAYKDAGRNATIYLGVFIASYLLNWTDILFFSKPEFDSKNDAVKSSLFTNFYISNACKIPDKNSETRLDFGIGIKF
jgi:hypothetical protein